MVKERRDAADLEGLLSGPEVAALFAAPCQPLFVLDTMRCLVVAWASDAVAAAFVDHLATHTHPEDFVVLKVDIDGGPEVEIVEESEAVDDEEGQDERNYEIKQVLETREDDTFFSDGEDETKQDKPKTPALAFCADSFSFSSDGLRLAGSNANGKVAIWTSFAM